MARAVAKHETRSVEPVEMAEPLGLFGPIDRAFERMFDAWPMWAYRRPMAVARQLLTDSFIRVDEYHENGSLVIKAELAGIDPDSDVELTVSDGMLRIVAQRREEETVEKGSYVRQELHRGSFERILPLPEGVSESDVTATYHEGILEIRVPSPEPTPAKRIAVKKA